MKASTYISLLFILALSTSTFLASSAEATHDPAILGPVGEVLLHTTKAVSSAQDGDATQAAQHANLAIFTARKVMFDMPATDPHVTSARVFLKQTVTHLEKVYTFGWAGDAAQANAHAYLALKDVQNAALHLNPPSE